MAGEGYDDLPSYRTTRQRLIDEDSRTTERQNRTERLASLQASNDRLLAEIAAEDEFGDKRFFGRATKAQFWTNTAPIYDPKSQFRWRVRIPGFSADLGNARNDGLFSLADAAVDDSVQLGIWYAKTIDKPSYAVKNLVEGRYPVDGVLAFPKITATSPELKPITMTLVDPVNPDATRVLAQYLRNGGFQEKTKPANSTQGYLSTNYPLSSDGSAAAFTVGEMYIEQLDSIGSVLERWTLIDPYPIEVNFGKLDYSSDDLVEISVTWGYRTFKVFFAGQPGANREEAEYFAEIPAANSLGGGGAGGLPGT
tara:strand:+ start:5002 stop:5931 length:930 start_codon:yes stop_codon:yes gene_type:complete